MNYVWNEASGPFIRRLKIISDLLFSVAHVEYSASPDGATLIIKRVRIANWHINQKTMAALCQAMSSSFSLQVVKFVSFALLLCLCVPACVPVCAHVCICVYMCATGAST